MIAICFAILDQILVRGEFTKQMRMSHREVTREHKEREGDPRIRQKRKQLHKEYASQSQGMGNLPGSDMLIVNPEHYARASRRSTYQRVRPQPRRLNIPRSKSALLQWIPRRRRSWCRSRVPLR